MKNKQLKFWLCNFKFFLSYQNLKIYFALKKDFKQEVFEQQMQKYIEQVLQALEIEYSVSGQENLITEPALYIFNHNSMFDSYFSYPVATKHAYFIAHEFTYSLKVPILGNFMKWNNSIFVNRTSLKAGIKAIKQGKEQLQKGNNLCIFAEGEITHLVKEQTEDLVGPFHLGSFKPAKDCQVPVIPVAIKGSDKIHTSHSFLGPINSGKVEVFIGKPIYDFVNNSQTTTKEVAQKTRESIISLLENKN
ncbi:MAG: lysophospholipid acyltransferase family protein [Mycoplasmatales bacterium]